MWNSYFWWSDDILHFKFSNWNVLYGDEIQLLYLICRIVSLCLVIQSIWIYLCLQLFKGTFYRCEGPDVSDIVNKSDCINKGQPYRWINSKYNFDNLGQVIRTCLDYKFMIIEGLLGIQYSVIRLFVSSRERQRSVVPILCCTSCVRGKWLRAIHGRL